MVQTTRLSIYGMSCGACIRHVARALDGMTGVINVDVDLERNEAIVEHLPDRADETSLVAAVTDAGYRATVEARGIDPADMAPSSGSGGCSAGCGCG